MKTTLPNIRIEQEYHTLDDKKIFLEQEAERMRNNPTEGEVLFKQFCDKYNIRYEHQVPVIVGYKGFILDFVITTTKNTKYKNSKKRKIAIEIDGEYHNTKEQKVKDAARTKTLNGAAYKVLRLTNDEVKDEGIIIRKFYEFLPTIKETELLSLIIKLQEYQKLKVKQHRENIEIINLKAALSDNPKQLETLTKLLSQKDKEIDNYKRSYEDLKKHYDELQKWSEQVYLNIGNMFKTEPPNRNVIYF